MADWEYIKENILQSITINDIIEQYTKNKIVRNRCKCFSCSGNQMRTMSLDKGYAYCFRCGKSYNQIQAVMEIKKCNFITACRAIINDFRLNIALDRPLTQQEKKQALKRKLERDNEAYRSVAEENFRRQINIKIIDKIRKCENYIYLNGKHNVEYYRNNDKVTSNLIICYKELKRLEWLYDKINDINRDENCEWEYTMPTDNIQILRKLYKGEIVI